MKPILYSPVETEYQTNGLGKLSYAISCRVKEERNGQDRLLKLPVYTFFFIIKLYHFNVIYQ